MMDMPSKKDLIAFINDHMKTSNVKVKRVSHYAKDGAIVHMELKIGGFQFVPSFMHIQSIDPNSVVYIINNDLHGYGSILHEIAYFEAYPKQAAQ